MEGEGGMEGKGRRAVRDGDRGGRRNRRKGREVGTKDSSQFLPAGIQ